MPEGHELGEECPLTLEAIAAWPIITYHEGFTGRGHIDDRFATAGLRVDVVMSALDADVIRAYVELGLGVGIMASMAFIPERDKGLRLIDCSHLFDRQTSRIAVRRGRYLRGYAYRDIQLCAPALTESVIRADAEARALRRRLNRLAAPCKALHIFLFVCRQRFSSDSRASYFGQVAGSGPAR